MLEASKGKRKKRSGYGKGGSGSLVCAILIEFFFDVRRNSFARRRSPASCAFALARAFDRALCPRRLFQTRSAHRAAIAAVRESHNGLDTTSDSLV